MTGLYNPGPLRVRTLAHERRGAIAVSFAIMSSAILGITGLTIDYGIYNQTYATLSLAASMGAMNAVKTAAAADLNNDGAYLAEGKTAGTAWFVAEIGAAGNMANLSNTQPTVTVTQVNTTITATVTYSNSVQPVFGRLFGVPRYNLSVQASAAITVAPYLEVQIMVDSSASMLLGAQPQDILAVEQLTPCGVAGPDYSAGDDPAHNLPGYPLYVCSAYGNTFQSSSTTCPIPTPSGYAAATGIKYLTPGRGQGPSCQNYPGAVMNPPGSTYVWPNAGSPCAFACHWDSNAAAGSGNDSYGAVRGTSGQTLCNQGGTAGSCTIQLRFDAVKAAVQAVITTMQQDTTAANNLTVGVTDFNNTLNRDYPTGGPEAGYSFSTALTAVGGPPTTPHGADTGIQAPLYSGVHVDTDFKTAAAALAGQLTAAGKGTSPTSPRKVLFIVSDGVQDARADAYNIRYFDTASCQLFKDLGFTVYVVYTPYQEEDSIYFFNYYSFFEPVSNSQLSQGLQQCASLASDFISANSQTELTAALQTFLKTALEQPASFTQ